MIFEFDPRTHRVAIEIGENMKLERLNKIPRPRPNEKVVMAINWNVFDWEKCFNGYGAIINEGKQIQAPSFQNFPTMSLKNGKLSFEYLPDADMGAGIAIALVLDGRVDIRNPGNMSTAKNHRTAFGQKKDGACVMVTEEAITTLDLAKKMLKLGCVIAFQGDSGDSTGYYDGTLHDHGRAIAGAIVVYRKKLIAIDDGHGYDTVGKRTPKFPDGSVMRENEFNSAVVQLLKISLENAGFDTLMVAPETTDTPLKTRTDRANKAKADLYISVHANAYKGEWGTHGGISTYHYPGSVNGKKAAELIHKNLLKGTNLRDRGVLTENFHVLRETTMPAVLCECAFMDNLEEAKLLLTGAYRQECADEIARGVCEYYGVAIPEAPKGMSVKEFQQAFGLQVDGIVGPITIGKMKEVKELINKYLY